MPKSYSGDLRERVIEAVELGASRRAALPLSRQRCSHFTAEHGAIVAAGLVAERVGVMRLRQSLYRSQNQL